MVLIKKGSLGKKVKLPQLQQTSPPLLLQPLPQYFFRLWRSFKDVEKARNFTSIFDLKNKTAKELKALGFDSNADSVVFVHGWGGKACS